MLDLNVFRILRFRAFDDEHSSDVTTTKNYFEKVDTSYDRSLRKILLSGGEGRRVRRLIYLSRSYTQS